MTTCCILGLGYIGLPTAAVLARAGHRVIGVDVNAQVVATVNQGQIHIVEPDLDQAVADAVASGALSAQLTPLPADVFLIAVPPPFRSGSDGIPQPNIDYVLAAARAIARAAARQSRTARIHLTDRHHRAGGPGDRRAFWSKRRPAAYRLLPRAGAARPHPAGTG
ncbi:UDP-glucose/GDP-mannose dehydrogenase family/ NAD binding domain protein [Synechococcus sp. MVIR-18-1]|nr:UDP-glucose/GDP-mannose dehydrogenase family/ NAD binding domain protein [Synechococcus sp. MVIR-18-1]